MAVEPGEWRPLLWSFSYFFALLCSYYMQDNMEAGFGPLPDAAMRKRMVAHYESL